MRSIRDAATRHPQAADAVLAAVLAGAFVLITGTAEGTTDTDWLFYVAMHVPLVWRRRAPLAVFAAVLGLGLICTAVDATGPFLAAVPMVAAYTVARHRSRVTAWWALSVLTVPLTVTWLWGGGEWWDVVALIALFAASILLGTYLQTRRAYLAELVDRAVRLERERDQQARLAVAAERTRIAREMHDIVAHNLAVMVALVDGAAATTPVAPDDAVDMMEKASATGREALSEIRRLVGLLRDGGTAMDGAAMDAAAPARSGPAPQPGFDDVAELVNQVRATGLAVTMTCDGEPGAWGPGAGLTTYRIVQEALTNTMKHAGTHARAEVRLRFTSTGLDLEVLDDGGTAATRPHQPRGFDGHGLAGMSERAGSYGGHVEAGPIGDSNWRVRAHLPFGEHVAS